MQDFFKKHVKRRPNGLTSERRQPKSSVWDRGRGSGEHVLPWREAGPPNHHDDKVDSDQYLVNKEVSLPAKEGSSDRSNTLVLFTRKSS